MRRFLLKVLAFLGLQLLILLPFWNSALPGEDNYLARTIDKHQRLRNTRSPRLILVGGSNLTFGIDSEKLERELHLPVVNMALSMPLGIKFMLDEVEDEVSAGDVVVTSFEYEMPEHGHEGMLTQMVEFRPVNFVHFPRTRQKQILDTEGLSIVGGIARRMLIQQFVSMSEEEGYKRQLFDERGSYLGHYQKKSHAAPFTPRDYVKLSENDRARIEQFAQTCRQRGALCLHTCPAHPTSFLEPLPAVVATNIATLKSISGLQLLDTPLDQAYPIDRFYDTVYHLTKSGASERTTKLIEELRPIVRQRRLASRN